jgi:hypothetical protein
MERFAPAALPRNPRAKTNLRFVGVKRRAAGKPEAAKEGTFPFPTYPAIILACDARDQTIRQVSIVLKSTARS